MKLNFTVYLPVQNKEILSKHSVHSAKKAEESKSKLQTPQN